MISIIIPLYNKERDINQTVRSVLKQSFQDFEIIIVNDGSTDESLNIVTKIKDHRIQIINQENKGVSAARNNGINWAKSNHIALLDADDEWDTEYLSAMTNLINEYPEAALYGSGYSFKQSENQILSTDLGLPESFKGYLDYFIHAKNNTLYTSSSVVFRRDTFYELGEFDTKLRRGEDIDLWFRFALNKKVAFHNKPLVFYNYDPDKNKSNHIFPREQCLIWNLSRFAESERLNKNFKSFLDNWRLAHVHNYLLGLSPEVDEIYTLLNDIETKGISVIWVILKHLPRIFQKPFYIFWRRLKKCQKAVR